MNLSERDKLYNWHPYTQHKTAKHFPAIVKGEGALLWDENNKEYIDAIASWWVNPFGHSNKIIADAIYKQLTTLEHVLFGGFTHEPAVLLAEKLIEILPSNQKKLFYSDNGSTAVEVAIKVAMQYFYNQNIKKTKIIAFEDAFHGDTFAAMAASGISFFTEAFQGSLLEVVRIPVPTIGNEEKTILLVGPEKVKVSKNKISVLCTAKCLNKKIKSRIDNPQALALHHCTMRYLMANILHVSTFKTRCVAHGFIAKEFLRREFIDHDRFKADAIGTVQQLLVGCGNDAFGQSGFCHFLHRTLVHQLGTARLN